jgi:hypothetical protein
MTVVLSMTNATVSTPDAAPDPVPVSVAVAATETRVPCLKDWPVVGEVTETDGAAVSIWIVAVLTTSVFPSLSVEKNYTAVVCEIWKSAVNCVLEVVGVEPSVV